MLPRIGLQLAHPVVRARLGALLEEDLRVLHALGTAVLGELGGVEADAHAAAAPGPLDHGVVDDPGHGPTGLARCSRLHV